MQKIGALLLTAILITPMTVTANEQIIRHKNAAHLVEPWAREFAEAIELPAAAEQIILSGVGPEVTDANAPADSVERYGDTQTQTRSVLRQIKEILARRGFQMGDIVNMQALIVGDPRNEGEADFRGFSSAYNQFFGTTDQPNVPARTRAQVIRLVPPGWLVEVTVTAARRR